MVTGKLTREGSSHSGNSGRRSGLTQCLPPWTGTKTGRSQKMWADNFAQLDKNGDGLLDRQEVEAAMGLSGGQGNWNRAAEQPEEK